MATRRRSLAYVVILLLAGCQAVPCGPPGRHEFTPKEWDVVVDTVERWEAFGLPPACWTYLGSLKVVVASNQEEWQQERGPVCGAPWLGPCDLPDPYWQSGHFDGARILIACRARPELDQIEPRILAHEVVHALEWCSWGAIDGAHANAYWGVVALQ